MFYTINRISVCQFKRQEWQKAFKKKVKSHQAPKHIKSEKKNLCTIFAQSSLGKTNVHITMIKKDTSVHKHLEKTLKPLHVRDRRPNAASGSLGCQA